MSTFEVSFIFFLFFLLGEKKEKKMENIYRGDENKRCIKGPRESCIHLEKSNKIKII
jgi:hypothetical protein